MRRARSETPGKFGRVTGGIMCKAISGAVDKSEGVVKTQNSRAVFFHRAIARVVGNRGQERVKKLTHGWEQRV